MTKDNRDNNKKKKKNVYMAFSSGEINKYNIY